jgi:transposase-like protein
MMRYRCEQCGTELIIGSGVETSDLFEDGMACPFDITHDFRNISDTPPDRLDAIRRRAEALEASEKTMNILINGRITWIKKILDELENQRLDRKGQ